MSCGTTAFSVTMAKMEDMQVVRQQRGTSELVDLAPIVNTPRSVCSFRSGKEGLRLPAVPGSYPGRSGHNNRARDAHALDVGHSLPPLQNIACLHSNQAGYLTRSLDSLILATYSCIGQHVPPEKMFNVVRARILCCAVQYASFVSYNPTSVLNNYVYAFAHELRLRCTYLLASNTTSPVPQFTIADRVLTVVNRCLAASHLCYLLAPPTT